MSTVSDLRTTSTSMIQWILWAFCLALHTIQPQSPAREVKRANMVCGEAGRRGSGHVCVGGGSRGGGSGKGWADGHTRGRSPGLHFALIALANTH